MKRERERGRWSFETLDVVPANKKVKRNHGSCLLPPQETSRPTLILDMDKTLVYASRAAASMKLLSGKVIPLERYQVAKRPWVDEFLREVSKDYEIVVFTRGKKHYADKILNKLDTGKVISHRLYKDSCSRKDGEKKGKVKDLARLNRDLKRVVIVDDKEGSFCLQPRNGVLIRPFKNFKDENDLELGRVYLLLKGIAGAADMRVELDRWKAAEHGGSGKKNVL